MRDKFYNRVALQIGLAVSASLAVLACGGNGAANNDQGMSVTFLGLFSSTKLATNNQGGGGGGGGGGGNITPGQQGCGQLPSGFAGGFLPLGYPAPEPLSTLGPDNASGIDPSGGFVSVIGIQNNLYGQAFRADRLLLDFYVAGATKQPPSTNVPFSLLVGPAESASPINPVQGGANPGLRRPQFTSLPPSFANLCNRGLSQAFVIPVATREWLNFNRQYLPEAPFNLEVTMTVSGLSSSGNRIETNSDTVAIVVLPETLVTPTEGVDPGATPTAAAVFEPETEQVDGLEVES
ncbi:MAG: hypothetical protein ACK5Y6_05725 [Pseudomonadota bacterium]